MRQAAYQILSVVIDHALKSLGRAFRERGFSGFQLSADEVVRHPSKRPIPSDYCNPLSSTFIFVCAKTDSLDCIPPPPEPLLIFDD